VRLAIRRGDRPSLAAELRAAILPGLALSIDNHRGHHAYLQGVDEPGFLCAGSSPNVNSRAEVQNGCKKLVLLL
jgi:hypothetical protein